MAINSSKKLTERGILATLLYELSQGIGTAWYSPFTRRVESTQPDGENNAWVGGIAGMTERKGDPKFDKLAAPSFFIRNIPFQTGLTIKKEDFIFGRANVIQQRIADLVPKAIQHPGSLILSAIAAAESTVCYDGQYFFDTDHSEGSSGIQDNDLTYAKAGTVPTVNEMIGAINTAIAGIWGFKDDKGEYCNLDARDFTVGAPVALMPRLLETLGITVRPGQSSTTLLDPNNGAYRLTPQILPGVTGNKIVLFINRANGMGSAFIHQVLMPTEPWNLGLESEHCKKTGELLFAVEGTYNVGYGRWQDACLVTFTGP